MSKGIDAIDETPSTKRSAGWSAPSSARRIPAMSDFTPVAVSLWVASTARIVRPVSARSAAPIAARGAPSPQGASIT
jgi:hypothetical protein